MSKDKKGSGSKMDDATMWKHMWIEKGLDCVVMEDKCRRLELRSMRVEDMIETLTRDSDARIVALEEIVNYLNSEEAKKDELIKKLEAQVENLTSDLAKEMERLNKEIENLVTHNEFTVNNLNLQLEAANVKLREMHDFAMKKQAMEQELIVLKEQIAKEQRDHAEAISDVERNAVQERERLKKEIQIRVEETKLQMTRLMEEQLHQKTKRTITENEQLKKEVAYHTRQTDMLMQKNEKLTAENADLHRSLILAKEIEEDLSRRNHMYQKTTRILVYKIRENQEALRKEKEANETHKISEKEKKAEQEELDTILSITVLPPGPTHPEATKVGTKEGQILEPKKPGEEAMKFLHACLEDLELERLMAVQMDAFSLASSGSLLEATVSQEGKRLDQLTLHERQTVIKKLLRAADQLRFLTDEMVNGGGGGDILDYSKFGQALPPVITIAKSNIRVDDILGMPTDNMHMDDKGRLYQWKKPTTAAVQADMSAHAQRSRNPMLF
ncbi:unnamed protein product [Calypogeia fissa]